MIARSMLKAMCVQWAPVGSRVTCDPAPTDTDEDFIVLCESKALKLFEDQGFVQEGLPGFYTGNDNGNFVSLRRGTINLICTPYLEFYELFLTATALAKRFNLLRKEDRIALFQAVLYGVKEDKLVGAPADLEDLGEFNEIFR